MLSTQTISLSLLLKRLTHKHVQARTGRWKKQVCHSASTQNTKIGAYLQEGVPAQLPRQRFQQRGLACRQPHTFSLHFAIGLGTGLHWYPPVQGAADFMVRKLIRQ